MPGQALSERVKQQARRRDLNARYQQAIDEYLTEKIRPLGPGACEEPSKKAIAKDEGRVGEGDGSRRRER